MIIVLKREASEETAKESDRSHSKRTSTLGVLH